MIRRNADILAVLILSGAAVLCSIARKVEIRDLLSDRTIVFEHHVAGPSLEVLTPLPAVIIN